MSVKGYPALFLMLMLADLVRLYVTVSGGAIRLFNSLPKFIGYTRSCSVYRFKNTLDTY